MGQVFFYKNPPEKSRYPASSRAHGENLHHNYK